MIVVIIRKIFKRRFIFIFVLFVIDKSFGQYRIPDSTFPFSQSPVNAITGGFGEVEAVSSDLYTCHGINVNPSLVNRKEKSVGSSFSYKSKYSDISLIEIAGFYSLNSKHTINLLYHRVNFADLRFTYVNPDIFSTAKRNDNIIQAGYSFAIKENFKIGFALKYLNSHIGVIPDEPSIKSVNTFAVDLGFSKSKSIHVGKNSLLKLQTGTSINNFGPRISYSTLSSENKQFLPTKLQAGILANTDIYLSEKMRLNIIISYQAEKYLVPTPPVYNYEDTTIIDGKDPDISPFRALYQSFYDAPDGFKEEIHEIIQKAGNEIRINFRNKLYGSVRHGRYIEHETKGNRKFNTLGFGVVFCGFTIDYYRIYADSFVLDKNWAITFGFRTGFK